MEWLVGSRKWSMAALFLASAVTLRVLGYVGPEGFIDALSTVMVAFMGSNVGEHLIGAIKDYKSNSNT